MQQYHRGFASSAFDVTISHPLQKKYIQVAMEEGGVAAQDAHDKKLQKSLAVYGRALCASPGSLLVELLRQFTTPWADGLRWRVLVVATRQPRFVATCTRSCPAVWLGTWRKR